MHVTIEVRLGCDAMQTPNDVREALARIGSHTLSDLPLQVGDGGNVRDVNGNTVGSWRVEE